VNENCVHIDVYAPTNTSAGMYGWNDDVCGRTNDRVNGYLCRMRPLGSSGASSSNVLAPSGDASATAMNSDDKRLFYTTGWAIGIVLASVVLVPVCLFVAFLVFKRIRTRISPTISLKRLDNVE